MVFQNQRVIDPQAPLFACPLECGEQFPAEQLYPHFETEIENALTKSSEVKMVLKFV